MYSFQTHFGFTNVGSKVFPSRDIAFSFWHFWSWTPCSSNAALIGKCDSKKGQVMCDMRINVDQIVISIFLGSTTPMLPMHAVYSPCISHSNIIFGQTVHSYS